MQAANVLQTGLEQEPYIWLPPGLKKTWKKSCMPAFDRKRSTRIKSLPWCDGKKKEKKKRRKGKKEKGEKQ